MRAVLDTNILVSALMIQTGNSAAIYGARAGMALGYFQLPDSVGFTHMAEAAAPGKAEFFATFLSILFVLNILLGSFNLLPVPPLDGRPLPPTAG